MSTNPPPTRTVTLNVARVDNGGNTGAGKYFYSFNDNIITIDQPDTEMTFELGADTASTIVVTGMVSSDSFSQLVNVRVNPDGRSVSVTNKNTVEYLIQVAVLAYDEKTGESFICDPQVINIPRPPVAGGA